MKWNLFLFSFLIYLVKYAIPMFEASGVKSNDFTSLQSRAILPSKMVSELRGQNTTWHQPLMSLWVPKSFSQWRIERRRGNREGDIVQPVPQTSKVHNIHAGYTNVSVSLRSGYSSEMGPVCPKTPTRLQGSDIKTRFAIFGTFWRVVLQATGQGMKMKSC